MKAKRRFVLQNMQLHKMPSPNYREKIKVGQEWLKAEDIYRPYALRDDVGMMKWYGYRTCRKTRSRRQRSPTEWLDKSEKWAYAALHLCTMAKGSKWPIFSKSTFWHRYIPDNNIFLRYKGLLRNYQKVEKDVQTLLLPYNLYTKTIGQLHKYHSKRKQWPNNLPNFVDIMQISYSCQNSNVVINVKYLKLTYSNIKQRKFVKY